MKMIKNYKEFNKINESVGFIYYLIGDSDNKIANVSKLPLWQTVLNMNMIKDDPEAKEKEINNDREIWEECIQDEDYITFDNFLENINDSDGIIFSDINKGIIKYVDKSFFNSK